MSTSYVHVSLLEAHRTSVKYSLKQMLLKPRCPYATIVPFTIGLFQEKVKVVDMKTIVDTCIKKNAGTDEQCANKASTRGYCVFGSRANECLFVPAGTERTIVSKLIQGKALNVNHNNNGSIKFKIRTKICCST